jgi:uncharacterized protein (DUF362 family)
VEKENVDMQKPNSSKNSRKVGLVRTTRYEDLVAAVTQLLRLVRFDFSKKLPKIAIKPNLCYYFTPSAGETTDPRLVEALVDVLRNNSVSDKIYIVESDATAMELEHAYKMLNYDELAKRKDLELINLSKDTLLPADTEDPVLKKISIPKILTEVDYFISMPKIKLHSFTGLTCALKNQFGCIPFKRKAVFHDNINKVIAFANKVMTPDLVLVDGLVCLGKTPKKLDLIMAGFDPVAIDFVAAKIAGLNPRRIHHLTASEKMGVGSTDVELVGDDLSSFAKSFPTKSFFYIHSRQLLMQLYAQYTRYFTLEGRVLKPKST